VTVTLPVKLFRFAFPGRLVKVMTSEDVPPVAKLTVVEAGEIEKPFTRIWSSWPVFAASVPATILGCHRMLEPLAAAVVTFTGVVIVCPGPKVKGAG
jgi:hypothetical protein